MATMTTEQVAQQINALLKQNKMSLVFSVAKNVGEDSDSDEGLLPEFPDDQRILTVHVMEDGKATIGQRAAAAYTGGAINKDSTEELETEEFTVLKRWPAFDNLLGFEQKMNVEMKDDPENPGKQIPTGRKFPTGVYASTLK